MARRSDTRKPILSIVAGCGYKNSDGSSRQGAIADYCSAGDPLDLIPEPKNRYDRNAVGVWADAQQIGYLDRHLAKRLVGFINEGGKLWATIYEVNCNDKNGGEDVYWSVDLRIAFEEEAEVPTAESYRAAKQAKKAAREGTAPAASVPTGGLRQTPAEPPRCDPFLTLLPDDEEMPRKPLAARARELGAASARLYHGLPDWAKPILWGAAVGIPLVAVMFGVRAAMR